MPSELELSSPMLPQSPSNIQPKPPPKRNLAPLLSIFFLKKPTVILALVWGLLCTFACFSFTLWLSKEVFNCPPWAVDCSLDSKVEWIVQHYALAQGVVTAISGTGIAAMGYAAFQLGETTIWPILHSQWLTLDELDTHISASRGSIPSLFRAISSIRSVESLSIVLCVAIVIGTQQANSVVVGHVYTRTKVPTVYKSNHSVGGAGMDLSFMQQNSPRAVPPSITTAASLYGSWSFGSSEEPLQQYRDYLFDRKAFADLGLTDFLITTVKAQRKIRCDGFPVIISDDTQMGIRLFSVQTNLQSGPVLLRAERRTAVWVDDIQYINKSRTVSTVVFAALDGNIEKGVNTNTTEPMRNTAQHIETISAVACSVDVTLIDNQHVGNDSDGSQPAMISDFKTVKGPIDSDFPLGGVAAWLGISITSFGVSTRGAQPMFESPDRNKASRLPKAYNLWLRNDDTNRGDNWTIAEVENFIAVGSGAVAMSIAINAKNTGNYTLVCSRQAVQRLDSSKAYILLYLTVPVLVVFLLLGWLSVWIHSNQDVPSLNTAHVKEIIVSSRALDFEKLLYEAESKRDISTLKVKYRRLSEGPVEFGLYPAH